MTVPLLSPLVEFGVYVVVPVFLAALVSVVTALLFRLKAKDRLPDGATIIVSLGVVSIYLNTRLALIEFVGGGADPVTMGEMWMNVAVFVGAAVAAFGGRRVGDRAAASERFRRPSFSEDLSPLVRATGRYIVVTVPDDIDDIEGYDTVTEETKKTLAGKTFTFPRGMTVDELRSQFSARLREQYEVGYVDVELDATGSVSYLAVGKRSRGLGPTLPTGTTAVALRADPAFSASPGDTVQIWHRSDDGGAVRVGRGELRASVGGIATVATTERVANAIDPSVNYRLMTLSADTHPDKEFAATLRRADETLGIVEITEGSPLVGSSVGALDVTVIAMRTGEEVTTLPTRDRVLAAGDFLFALGRPDLLRKLEAAARPGGEPTPTAQVSDLLGVPVAAAGWSVSDDAERRRREDREDWTTYEESGDEES